MDNNTEQRKSARSAWRAILPITGILLMAAAAICTCASVLSSEKNSKYLTDSTPKTMLSVFIILSIVFTFFSSLFYRKERQSEHSLLIRAFSLLPTAASLYSAYFFILKGADDHDTLLGVLALLSAVFFALKVFGISKPMTLLFGFAVFAYATAIIAFLYLDFNIELNSPYKLALQFGAVGLIFGVMSDSRVILSRMSSAWYLILKSMSLLLALISASMTFTAFAADFSVFPQSYLAYAILYSSLAISALAELTSFSAVHFKNRI